MMSPIVPKSRGFALIIVLMVLILCAVLVISLMMRSSVSLQTSTAYSHATQVRTLSEMAIARVQAQVRDATTFRQLPETPLDERSTWASQPGAIRVYGASGELEAVYKLYSASQMVQASGILSGDVPGDWYERPYEFTDLNQPVYGLTGLHYPIFHPDAGEMMSGASGIRRGFSISDQAPLQPMEGDLEPNQAPMPVRWIYILEDGTHCDLGDARIHPQTNPIIGRIAFWTDDETAKVNLNTAAPVGPSSFWDVPRAWSRSEIDPFALFQPSQNEYQRYPGHPALVSLVPILGSLSNLGKADYYALTPRYRWGGSEDGSRNLNVQRVSLLVHKEDRAYATVDELLFQSRGGSRHPELDEEKIEALRFFLTTSSRSPELNLFGQPRISLWPIFGNPDQPDPGDQRRTFYDRLSLNAATVAGKPYYFTREDPLSPTHDYEEIERNQELYQYLQRLTEVPVPGFGESDFLTKYGNDRDQILTQMFDYIRIVNLNETYEGKPSDFLSYTTNWQLDRFDGSASAVNTGTDYQPNNTLQGAGMVTPIQIGATRGMGRFPVINEVGMMFVTHAQRLPRAVNPVVPEAPHLNNPEQLEAMLLFETITPAFGYMPWCGTELYLDVVRSDVKFRVGTREVDLVPSGALGRNPRPIYYPPLLNGGLTPGGYDGAAYVQGQGPHWVGGSGGGMTRHPFFSDPLDLVPQDTEFSVIGGEIVVELRVRDVVVQTYRLTVPDIDRLPRPIRAQADYTAGFAWTVGRPWWSVRGTHGAMDGDVLHSLQLRHGDARLIAGKRTVDADFIPHRDYGKDQQFAHGLLNQIAQSPMLWNGGTVGQFVDLPLMPPRVMPPSDAGPERTHRRRSAFQKVPAQITSLKDAGWSGDYDNAWAYFPDGPFINKPDEGMMNRSVTGTLAGTANPYASFRWSNADGLFSPVRQIPSAVMFGSLPTGVHSDEPWRTLLFTPHPPDANHFGKVRNPPDYLFLDLFRMPVCEPFSMSGPASTDGKINLNYAIAPFSYIRRASAWYSLLEPLKFFAVPDDDSQTFKGVWNSPTAYQNSVGSGQFRYSVDVAETLRQFEARFASNDLFRSAAEICAISLVPAHLTLEDVADFWAKHQLTGDNSREKPYAELYPKLTTQSNTYRIHYRVQLLPRSGGLPVHRDDFQPLAEYRGSRLIERYLPPAHPGLAAPFDPDQHSLQALYKYRTLENLRFAP